MSVKRRRSPGGPQCALRDLTPPAGGSQHAGVLGVLAASADGTRVYFAANGALTSEADAAGEHAVNGTCRRAQAAPAAALCNLYEVHYTAGGWGAPRLLAVLSGADQPDWSPLPEHHTARSSPDGLWLAFSSLRSLTGYDNEDAGSPAPGLRPDQEVYLYHAGTGVLCASCNPTGARPDGAEYRTIGAGSVWPPSTWVAASIPASEPYETGAALYQPRYLSDGGRLFFDSVDALVPQDSNGAQDVYEYEPSGYLNPTGAERCAPETVTFSEAADGCVSMISSPASETASSFLDASVSGGDAFFLSSAKLTGADHDSAFDVYDAHECAEAASCPAEPEPVQTPPECASVVACSPTPGVAPSNLTLPASASFTGASGVLAFRSSSEPEARRAVTPTRAQKLAKALRACRRQRPGRRRAACQRTARRKYGPTPKAGRH